MTLADSDPIRKQTNHLFFLQHEGRLQEALAGVEEMLRDAAELPEDVLAQLNRWQSLWSKALDPEYAPPPYPEPNDFEPLRVRSSQHLKAGRYSDGLQDAWAFLQYAPYGTMTFHRALRLAIEAAIRAGRVELAQQFARSFLAHDALLRTTLNVPETQKSVTATPYEGASPSDLLRYLDLSLPGTEARIALASDPAPIWAEILEAVLASPDQVKVMPEHSRRHAAQILARYYLEEGNQAALEQLRRNYPTLLPEDS